MHNLNDVKDILQAFIPSRSFRRGMKNSRCHMCGLGCIAADIALLEVELKNGREETRIIHKQCAALVWDFVDELRGVTDDWAADPGVDG